MRKHLQLIVYLILINYSNSMLAQTAVFEYAQPFKDSLDLRPYTRVFVDSTRQMTLQQVQNQSFMPLDSLRFGAGVATGYCNYWLQFETVNRSATDTLSLSFSLIRNTSISLLFLGMVDNKCTDSLYITYKQRAYAQLNKPFFPSYRTVLFKLPPLTQKKAYVCLYSDDFQQPFYPMLFREQSEASYFFQEILSIRIWNVAFIAVLIFAFGLAIINFVQQRHASFLYYAGYILAQLLFYWRELSISNQFSHDYFPITLLSYSYRSLISYGWFPFYVFFTFSFLNAKQEMPKLYRYSMYLFYLYAFMMLSDRCFVYYDTLFAMKMIIYPSRLFSILGLCLAIYMFIQLRNHRLGRYVLAGTLCYAIGSIVTRFSSTTSPFWDDTLLAHQLGLLRELFCFSAGLGYKAKQDAIAKDRFSYQNEALELQNQQLSIQKERFSIQNQALELRNQELSLEKQALALDLRQQIMQDFHDDFGVEYQKLAYRTAAATSSENASNLKQSLLTTAQSVRQLYQDTRHAIEISFPNYHYFDELQAHFQSFATDFWDGQSIKLHFDFPDAPPKTEVSLQIIYELSRIFKEVQNNISKHAQTTDIYLTLKYLTPNCYWLEIRDNGLGFDPNLPQAYSNRRSKPLGLSGIYHRALKIKGLCFIQSIVGRGTTIQITGFLVIP
jgi:signal transduction histidine kinase